MAETLNIVSTEEERMARFLRERNLERTNEISRPVFPKNTFYTRHGKRILDLFVAVPAFTLTLPFNGLFALCTYFDVGRPILFKQERTGKDGRSFTMVKFRNMSNKCGPDGHLLPASERVTRFGRFMRKYSFDELLNLWSVVKGDMSIIGPRPYPTFFTDRMSERHKMRFAVRPGIECPKMISLPNEKERLYNVKLENDIWYVEHVCLATDVKMFFKLFDMVFAFRTRAKHAGGLSYFVGYDDDGFALGTREAREYLSGEETFGQQDRL